MYFLKWRSARSVSSSSGHLAPYTLTLRTLSNDVSSFSSASERTRWIVRSLISLHFLLSSQYKKDSVPTVAQKMHQFRDGKRGLYVSTERGMPVCSSTARKPGKGSGLGGGLNPAIGPLGPAGAVTPAGVGRGALGTLSPAGPPEGGGVGGGGVDMGGKWV